jgi:hypothetical protein
MQLARYLALVLLAPLLALTAHAQTILAPDLHAGGANPSSIPNQETTEVTLPGHNLTGTTLTVSGVCTLKSYKVVSDTEIDMQLEGNRPVDGKEDGCFLKVSHGAKQASTYVIVDLTDAEQQQQTANQAAAAQAKANAYMANLGAQWTVRFANGSTEVFTAQPADPGQLPDFTSSSGGTKIMISNGSVVILADGCMLSGTLTGNQVKDGQVTAAGDCKHSGTWTAQKK